MGLMSEYINKKMGVKELVEELIRLIKKYNDLENTYLLVYASAIGKAIPDIPLSIDDCYIVSDILRNVESKNLDIYIETHGGSGEAVEDIVEFIRSKFVNIKSLISGEAKSAGTLLALSCDEILMTDSGSLGPIDAQIKIGRSQISAYDYMEWIENKRKEAKKTGKLNPLDATMVAQISPGEISLVNHSMKFAEDLVIEWLPKYKFKNWKTTAQQKKKVTDEMKKQRAGKIAKELINHAKWRTHGRSLKIQDLESIGLKIIRIDEEPKLADIIYRIQTIIRLLFSSSTNYKIFVTADEKIFKSATPAGPPPKIPIGDADVAEFETKCPKCGKNHKIYVKFKRDPKIDNDLQKKGLKLFPTDNMLICECGHEIDLSGIKNEIERNIGKQIVKEDIGEPKKWWEKIIKWINLKMS